MKFRIVSTGESYRVLEVLYKGKWTPCCEGGYTIAELGVSMSAKNSRIMYNSYTLFKDCDGNFIEPPESEYKSHILQWFESPKAKWIEDRKEVDARHEEHKKHDKLKKKLNKIVIEI